MKEGLPEEIEDTPVVNNKVGRLRQAAQEIETAQEQFNELVKQLETLDFSDVGNVLEWCVAYQELGDNVNVEHTTGDTNKIVAKFAEHGYVPEMNMDAANYEDKESSARYIIGQALSGLNNSGFISRVIHNFYDDWRAKFIQ